MDAWILAAFFYLKRSERILAGILLPRSPSVPMVKAFWGLIFGGLSRFPASLGATAALFV